MTGEFDTRRAWDQALRDRTRRHFFADCGIGLGAMALSSLLGGDRPALAGAGRDASPSRSRMASNPLAAGANPMAARPGHFPARARSVIYLFMAGGPSQLELFDYKPRLQEYSGRPIPDSFIQGRRFAFMDIFTKEHPKLLGTVRKFARHGASAPGSRSCCPTWPAWWTT